MVLINAAGRLTPARLLRIRVKNEARERLVGSPQPLGERVQALRGGDGALRGGDRALRGGDRASRGCDGTLRAGDARPIAPKSAGKGSLCGQFIP